MPAHELSGDARRTTPGWFRVDWGVHAHISVENQPLPSPHIVLRHSVPPPFGPQGRAAHELYEQLFQEPAGGVRHGEPQREAALRRRVQARATQNCQPLPAVLPRQMPFFAGFFWRGISSRVTGGWRWLDSGSRLPFPDPPPHQAGEGALGHIAPTSIKAATPRFPAISNTPRLDPGPWLLVPRIFGLARPPPPLLQSHLWGGVGVHAHVCARRVCVRATCVCVRDVCARPSLGCSDFRRHPETSGGII